MIKCLDCEREFETLETYELHIMNHRLQLIYKTLVDVGRILADISASLDEIAKK
ncbi:MAG: hypothetical protein QW420_06340 [Candidatus Caldarchaeum sp.]